MLEKVIIGYSKKKKFVFIIKTLRKLSCAR